MRRVNPCALSIHQGREAAAYLRITREALPHDGVLVKFQVLSHDLLDTYKLIQFQTSEQNIQQNPDLKYLYLTQTLPI